MQQFLENALPTVLKDQIVYTEKEVVFTKHFMQGNEALVEGMLAAGVTFFAGYPITPSSEILEQFSIKLPKIRGHFIQMEDEIASLGAVLGASLAGTKAITATSGPGFSLMQELIGYASMAQIPCVIVNVMRGGPSTGMPTMTAQADVQQAIWGTHGDHAVVVVAPGSVSEMFFLSIWCMNIAQRLRIPVIMLPDEIIAHMRESLYLPPKEVIKVEQRTAMSIPAAEYHPYRIHGIAIPVIPPLGTGYRYNTTGLVYDEDGFPTNDEVRAEELTSYLIEKVRQRSAELSFAEHMQTHDAEVILIAYGSTSLSARHALTSLRSKNCKVGLFRPITMHPFPLKELKQLTTTCSNFLLIELNRGQITIIVQSVLGTAAKLATLNRSNGVMFSPLEIEKAVYALTGMPSD